MEKKQNPEKLLFIDIETTGLNIDPNAEAFQVSIVVDIDGEIQLKRQYNMCPTKNSLDNMAQEAAETHGIAAAMISLFEPQDKVYRWFIEDLSKYVDKFDKEDKFVTVAYNANFDIHFLSKWSNQNNDKYLGSFIDRKRTIDPLSVLRWYQYTGIIPYLKDTKLLSVCNYFNIDIIKAHDSLFDALATRELFYILKNNYKVCHES